MITIQSLTIKQLNYEKGKDPVRYECGQMQLSFVCRWRQLPGDPSRHQAGRSRTELTESKISKELKSRMLKKCQLKKKLFSVSGGIRNQSGWFLEKLKLKQFCSVFVKDKKNLNVLIWLLSLKIAINERKLTFCHCVSMEEF